MGGIPKLCQKEVDIKRTKLHLVGEKIKGAIIEPTQNLKRCNDYKCLSPFHMKCRSVVEGCGHGFKHLVCLNMKVLSKANA